MKHFYTLNLIPFSIRFFMGTHTKYWSNRSDRLTFGITNENLFNSIRKSLLLDKAYS